MDIRIQSAGVQFFVTDDADCQDTILVLSVRNWDQDWAQCSEWLIPGTFSVSA